VSTVNNGMLQKHMPCTVINNFTNFHFLVIDMLHSKKSTSTKQWRWKN